GSADAPAAGTAASLPDSPRCVSAGPCREPLAQAGAGTGGQEYAGCRQLASGQRAAHDAGRGAGQPAGKPGFARLEPRPVDGALPGDQALVRADPQSADADSREW